MTENEKELLQKAGIDLEDTLQRFLGNEVLYIKFLLKFPQDQNFYNWKQLLRTENYDVAFHNAHTLKGLAGNLGLKELYERLIPYMEYLRDGRVEEAKEKEKGIIEAYEKAIEVIAMISR